MADLLGANALKQILIGLGRCVTAKVDALKQVLHHGAHFAELAAESLLECVRGGGIRLVDGDLVDELLSMQVHITPR